MRNDGLFPLFIVCLGSLCFISYKLNQTRITLSEKSSVVYVASNYRTHYPRNLDFCAEDVGRCFISTDPKDRLTADAVVFYNRDDVNKLKLISPHPNQVYIWKTHESPVHEKVKLPSHFVNWTMNYRKDADVWQPYGFMMALPSKQPVNFDAIWDSKKAEQHVGWMVSNCPTKNRRKAFVDAMISKGLKAEIWGKCGKKLPNCPQWETGSWVCAEQLLRPYKFYFALENSHCPDYITEKFWNALISYWSVPIVAQRLRYQKHGIPDHLFIAVDDYETIEDMIKDIERIANDREEYMKYHEWRTTYKVANLDAFCGICRKLQNQQPGESKSYADLAKWYSSSTCEDDFFLKYLNSTKA